MLIFTVIIFLAILIVGHELGHFFAAKKFGVRVDEFGFGLPPRIVSRKAGETRFSLNLLPLGGFVKIHGQQREEGEIEEPHRAFINQPISRRAIILISGVAANFIIGWIALSLVFTMGIPPKLLIAQVLPGSAAETAGLKVNESIEGWSSAEEFINFVQINRGKSITVNGKTVNVPEGGVIGVRIEVFSVPKQNPFQSIVKGFEAAAAVTVGVTKAATQIIISAFTGGDGLGQVAGPVGIFNIIKEAKGAALLIYLLGVISLNLAILNLLPIPALDGGHLLFLGIEKLINRPVSHRAQTLANAIGFALLILLIIMVTFKDIARL